MLLVSSGTPAFFRVTVLNSCYLTVMLFFWGAERGKITQRFSWKYENMPAYFLDTDFKHQSMVGSEML